MGWFKAYIAKLKSLNITDWSLSNSLPFSQKWCCHLFSNSGVCPVVRYRAAECADHRKQVICQREEAAVTNPDPELREESLAFWPEPKLPKWP